MKLRPIALVALLLLAGAAHATTNLPLVCTIATAEGQSASAASCNGGMRFELGTPTSLVRVCDVQTCTYTQRIWRKLGAATAAQFIEVCSGDKTAGPAVDCRGSTTTTWGGMRMIALSQVRTLAVEPAPTTDLPGTFTVTPSTGVAPLTVTITWDVSSFTGATCAAGGSWGGAKALSGAQQVTGLTANASYQLTCTRPVLGSATLTWAPPTTNTDGSALTNLASYTIKYGASATALTQSVAVPTASANSFVVRNLNPGTWYFGVTATNADGKESGLSNVASKTVASAVDSRTAIRTVTVTQPVPPTPNPPVLQVVQTDVFNALADYSQLAFRPSLRYGTVPLGTPCDPAKPIKDGYFSIPLTAVQWSGTGRTSYPVARCAVL